MAHQSRRLIASTVTLFALLSMAPAVQAQSVPEPRRTASFTTGASFGDGDTALALSTDLNFSVSRRLGIDFEVAYARKLDFTIDLCPAPRVCVIGGQVPVTGRTVSLVPHLVYEFIAKPRRLRVYAQAGAGAGHVRQRYWLGRPFTPVPSNPVELTRSSLTAALSFGGGATLQIQRLGVGLDVRSLHLFDEEATLDRFITPAGTLRTLRVGARASWRF